MSRHRFIRNLSKEDLLDDGYSDSDYDDDDDDDDNEEEEEESGAEAVTTGSHAQSAEDAARDASLMQQVHEITAHAFSEDAVYDALYETEGHVEEAVQLLFGDRPLATRLAATTLANPKAAAVATAASAGASGRRTPSSQRKAATKEQSQTKHSRPPAKQQQQQQVSKKAVKKQGSTDSLKATSQQQHAAAVKAPPPPKKLSLDPAVAWQEREAMVQTGARKPTVHVAVVGHVDAGKSTLVGHLLQQLQLVDAKQFRQHQKQAAALNKGSFVYAWALDSSEEERERGVTMDTATMSFRLPDRDIVILDNPGHKDFVANMIRGSCKADVGVLVISAVTNEFLSGFQGGGQTKEHAVLLRSTGIRSMVVAVNKMDQVDWSEARFQELVATLTAFLVDELGFKSEQLHFVPVSGLGGINLVTSAMMTMGDGSSSAEEGQKTDDLALPTALTSWYSKGSLCDVLNAATPREMQPLGPTRFFVDDAVPGGMGNATVTCTGRLLRGNLQVQQQVLLLPQRLYGIIKSIHSDEGTPFPIAFAGDPPISIALTGVEANEVETYTILCQDTETLQPTDAFRVTIKVFDGETTLPILNGTPFIFHAQGWESPATVRALHAVLDAAGQPLKKVPRVIQPGKQASISIQLQQSMPIESRSSWKDGARFLMRVKGTTIGAGLVDALLPLAEEKLDTTVFSTGLSRFDA